MRTSEVLNKAADLIEQRGWGRGPSTWEGVGGLCVEGAIAAALGRSFRPDADEAFINSDTLNYHCPAGLAVRAYLDMSLVDDTEDLNWLCHWNDRASRTAAEVIEVLRAAAVIEEAKERQDAPAAAEAVSA